jgi:hypothetical protein
VDTHGTITVKLGVVRTGYPPEWGQGASSTDRRRRCGRSASFPAQWASEGRVEPAVFRIVCEVASDLFGAVRKPASRTPPHPGPVDRCSHPSARFAIPLRSCEQGQYRWKRVNSARGLSQQQTSPSKLHESPVTAAASKPIICLIARGKPCPQPSHQEHFVDDTRLIVGWGAHRAALRSSCGGLAFFCLP